jgi:hypothetical protein
MTGNPITDAKVQNLNPEAAQRPVEMMVKEWRQVAIAEGIAPTKVDRYLLTRADVPDDVKSLIQKHISAEQRDVEGAGPGVRASETVSAGEPLSPRTEVSSIPASMPVEQPKAVSGEIDMLNARSEIESIKRDVIGPSEAEMGPEIEEAEEMLPASSPEDSDVFTEDDASAAARERQYVEAGPSGRVPIGISGYSPSKDVADNAQEIADKGPISDAKTWQAMLLQRFLEIWGSFKGIFSQ